MTPKAINPARNHTLSHHLTVADTFWSSLRGLLGKHSLPAGEGLLLVPCQSVHTLGMRFPIDVVFLDKERRVLHIIEGMKPWRISRHLPKARSVLELPAGTIAATGTRCGDVIQITD